MGTETLVKGHAFDDTGICSRCGMDQDEYEAAGEPQCTERKAGAAREIRPPEDTTLGE